MDGIETATKEGERCNDEERNELQFLEPIRPDADDKTQQTKCYTCHDEEENHP